MLLNRLKHHRHQLLISLFTLVFSLLLSLCSLPLSQAIPVSEVPNPRQDNGWVMDMADLLTPDSEAKLNQMITALEETNGAEIAVVTVLNTRPAATPKAFTTQLFNTWGIGKKGLDNGVLFMVSKEDRRVEIETGYGIESILPDTQVGNIIQTQVTPQFKQGNFDRGILQGTQAIIRVLKNPAVSSFNRLEERIEKSLNPMVVIGSLTIIGFMSLAAKKVVQVCRNIKALQHSPVGTATSSTSVNPLVSLWVSVLRWFAGDSQLVENQEQRPISPTLTRTIFQCWQSFIILFSGLLLLYSIFMEEDLWKVLLLCWAWFGFEIWCCAAREQPMLGAIQFTLNKLGWTILLIGILVIIIFIAPTPLLAVVLRQFPELGGMIVMYPVAISGAASAGALRMLRALAKKRCPNCSGPLTPLEDEALERYLKPTHKIAKRIKSTHYKGWLCLPCSTDTDSAKTRSAFHLTAVQHSNQFERCKKCDVYTVIKTFKILQRATHFKNGEARMTRQCACCAQTNEMLVSVWPSQRDRRWGNGHSSSSYSTGSSFGSGGSSDSSSSSSGGSDFGGGSSGGGGAGGSW